MRHSHIAYVGLAFFQHMFEVTLHRFGQAVYVFLMIGLIGNVGRMGEQFAHFLLKSKPK